MDRLEYWTAVMSGLCSMAAVMTVGVPAIMHYGQATHTEWRTGVILAVCAGVFFATSITTAVVNGVRSRGKDRDGDSIKEE